MRPGFKHTIIITTRIIILKKYFCTVFGAAEKKQFYFPLSQTHTQTRTHFTLHILLGNFFVRMDINHYWLYSLLHNYRIGRVKLFFRSHCSLTLFRGEP